MRPGGYGHLARPFDDLTAVQSSELHLIKLEPSFGSASSPAQVPRLAQQATWARHQKLLLWPTVNVLGGLVSPDCQQ